MNDDQLSLIAKALAHPVRIGIVRLLAAQSECRGHEVFSEIPLAQSTTSEHIRVLKEAGLIRAYPAGTAMVYCLVATVLDEFCQAIGQIEGRTVDCVSGQGEC